MFEHHKEPLLSRADFFRRMARYVAISFGITVVSLLIGILAYHYFEGLSWLDSLLNAAMLLGGMGPVAELHTVAGKIFASFYALFAGMVLLVAVGVLASPIIHRFLHYFHVELEEEDESSS